jgi:tetratricopeptide (TPR) repeat protein
MPGDSPSRRLLFISYAREDQRLTRRLVTHLGVLRHSYDLDIWFDERIVAGEEWEPAITSAMDSAVGAILVVSAHFLDSDFILKIEVPHLLNRGGGLKIIPVIISKCDWAAVDWLRKLQVIEKDEELGSPGDEDAALADVATKVRQALPLALADPQSGSGDDASLRREAELDVAGFAEHLRRHPDYEEALRAIELDLAPGRDGAGPPPFWVAPAKVLRGAPDKPDGAVGFDGPRSRLLVDVVAREPVIVVRGDPGAGKSTSCRALALWMLREGRAEPRVATAGSAAADEGTKPVPPSPLVPVVVELRYYGVRPDESPSDALARMIASQLRDNRAITGEVNARRGHALLEGARARVPLTLFFDGLNEVATDSRDHVRDALTHLIADLRETPSRVGITTRRQGLEAFRLGALPLFDVQPLSPDKIKEYLKRRLGKGDEEVGAIYERLHGPRVRLQTSIPLHLNMLCALIQQGRAVPRCRAELFEGYVTSLLEWKPTEDSDRKRQALELLAYEMQPLGTSLETGRAVGVFCRALRCDEARATALKDELCQSGLLLPSARDGRVSFRNQPLQEFFCASRLNKIRQGFAAASGGATGQPDFEQALDDPAWWEPVALVGGLVSEDGLDDLLHAARRQPELCGRILGNAPAGTESEKRFLARAERRLALGIRLTMIAGQVLLLLSAVAAVVGVYLVAFRLAGLLVSLPIVLGADPLAGIGWLAWVWVVALLLLVFPASERVALVVARAYDGLLRLLIGRLVEPWKWALHYVNSSEAEFVLGALHSRFASHKLADAELKEHLRVFTERGVEYDRGALVACLEDPRRRALARSFLGDKFDEQLAAALCERLPSRNAEQQAAYLEVFERWLARFSDACRPLVERLISLTRDGQQRRSLRAALSRLLRRRGVKVERVWTWTTPMVWGWDWCAGCWRGLMNLLLWLPARVIEEQKTPNEFGGLSRWAVRWFTWWAGRLLLHPGPQRLAAVATHLDRVGDGEAAERIIDSGLRWYANIGWFHRTKARLLFSRKQWEPAAREYQGLLRLHPDDKEARWKRIDALRGAKRITEARAAAEQLLQLYGDDVASWEKAIHVECDAAPPNTGLIFACLDEALRRFPDAVGLLDQLGCARFNYQSNYHGAAEAFRQALTRAPGEFGIAKNLALSLCRLRQFDEALAAARAALRTEPGRPERWEALARMFLQEGALEAGGELADEAGRLFPDDRRVVVVRAELAGRRKQDTVAVALYEAAVAQRPTDAELLRRLAEARWQAGAREAAVQAATRLLEAAPDQPASWETLLGYLIDSGRATEAGPRMDEALGRFPERAWLHYQHGVALESQNDYSRASEAYRAAARLAPGHPIMRRALIRSLRLAGQVEQARQVATQARDDAPRDPQAWEQLATFLYDARQYGDCSRVLDDALQRFPDGAALWRLRGLCWDVEQRFDAAADCYCQMLRLEPNNSEGLRRLAASLRSAKRPDEACAAAEALTRAAPDDPATWQLRADLLIENQQVEPALQVLQQARGKFLGNADLPYRQGQLLDRMKSYREAAGAYQSALELLPHNALLLRCAAGSLWQAGEASQALALARRALSEGPDEPANWELLGGYLLDSGARDEGRQVLADALGKFPDSPALFFRRGRLLDQEGHYAEAAGAYRRALELLPDHPEVLRSLANSLRLAGRLDEARAVAERAVDVAPDYVGSWCALLDVLLQSGAYEQIDNRWPRIPGRLQQDVELLHRRGIGFYQREKYDAAAGCFRTALEQSPDHAEVLARLTHALRYLGQVDEARRQAERAVELAPDALNSWHCLFYTLIDLRQADEAARLLDRVTERFPSEPAVHLWRADLFYYGRRQYQEAVRAYRAFVERNPSEDHAQRNLIDALRIVGEVGDSRHVAEQLVARSPRYVAGWRSLVLTLIYDKQWREAERRLDESLACFPDDLELTRLRAVCCLGQLQYARAAELYGNALRLTPEDEALLRGLALALRELGEPDEAWRVAERAAARSRDKWLTEQMLLYSHLAMGRVEEARLVLNAVREHVDDVEDWYQACAEIELSAGGLDRARAALDQGWQHLLTVSPRPAPWIAEDWLLLWAEVFLRLGQTADAARALREVLSPTDASWHAFLLALADDTALSAAPSDPLVARLRAWAAYRFRGSPARPEPATSWPALPEQGISRASRQACCWLELEIGRLTGQMDALSANRLERRTLALSPALLRRTEGLLQAYAERRGRS